MKRKVIQIANSTQLISLPRKWAQKHNVKKGDELEVTIDGAQLLIGGKKSSEPMATTLEFKKGEPYIKRALSTKYKLGYDEVEITYAEPSMINDIKKHTEDLLGFEIIHQSAKRCIVKNVASTMESEFDNILRRIFLMLVSLARDSYTAVQNKETNELATIADLEKTNNKLTFFCERILNKYGYPEEKRQCLLHTMVCMLEQTADSFGYICHQLAKEKQVTLDKKTLEAYLAVVELTDEIYQAFYDFSVSKLMAFKEKKEKAERQCYEVLKKGSSSQDTIVAHHLLVIMYQLHHTTECLV